MIKYYCDKCGKEMQLQETITIHIRCYKLLHSREIKQVFCRDCAINVIGKDIVEAEEKKREEKEKAYQERLKERKKNGGLAMNQPTEKQIKFAEDIANTLDIHSVDFRAMSYEEVTEFITENKDDYYQRRYDNN